MEYKVLTYGNPVLRKKSEEVKEIDDEIRAIVADMEKTLGKENGVGLAAPQVGISKRILIVDLSKSKLPNKITLINPKIVYKSADKESDEEGCLSLPEIWGEVMRHVTIKIKGKVLSGRTILIEANGYFARALQHEMDHLDGKLFIDYFSQSDREKNTEKINALVEKNKAELGEVVL